MRFLSSWHHGQRFRVHWAGMKWHKQILYLCMQHFCSLLCIAAPYIAWSYTIVHSPIISEKSLHYTCLQVWFILINSNQIRREMSYEYHHLSHITHILHLKQVFVSFSTNINNRNIKIIILGGNISPSYSCCNSFFRIFLT